MHSKQLIFLATGQRCRTEVLVAATTAGKNCTNAIKTLFTDSPAEFSQGTFDQIIEVPADTPAFSQKIWCMLSATGEQCLFLDTDTLVTGDIDPLFGLLEQCDIAAAHASWRFSPGLENNVVKVPNYMSGEAPEAFVDFNTGVVLFRRSSKVFQFFADWQLEYSIQQANAKCYPANDQPSFRSSLWRSRLRFYILPPEYNYRADFPGFVSTRVRILHGRHSQINEIAELLNSRDGARIFDPETWQLLVSRLSEE